MAKKAPLLLQQESMRHMSAGVMPSEDLLMDEIRAEVKRVVPPLSADSWKGQCGKVGVLGGCTELTGAPYFVAMASLKVGADLSHVFTTKGAAPTVKSYSPELMVHPLLKETHEATAEELQTEELRATLVTDGASEIEAWFTRLDCLVIGPGLGRDPLLLDVARSVIIRAKRAGLPLVLDGDALFLVAREPELVLGYSSCVLTPNLNEFRRLATVLGISMHGPNNDRLKKLSEVTRQLKGPVLISKGPIDAIHDGRTAVVCSSTGGLRRCGGQGDILAGSIAVFVSWTLSFLERAKASGDSVVLPEMNPMILASFGGCLVTRTATALGFNAKRRSMLAGDILDHLGVAVEDLFDPHVGIQEGRGNASLARNES